MPLTPLDRIARTTEARRTLARRDEGLRHQLAEQIRTAREQDYTMEAIAAAAGVSKPTVYKLMEVENRELLPTKTKAKAKA